MHTNKGKFFKLLSRSAQPLPPDPTEKAASDASNDDANSAKPARRRKGVIQPTPVERRSAVQLRASSRDEGTKPESHKATFGPAVVLKSCSPVGVAPIKDSSIGGGHWYSLTQE